MTMLLIVTLSAIAPLPSVLAQPSNIECTGVMAMHSPSGSPHGPWTAPQLLYNPSAKNASKEWYSVYGIDNPALVVLPNGTTLLAGRTCSGPEHPFIARADTWDGVYRSIGGEQPFAMNNVEDPFLWVDHRGNYHALHHWQDDDHNLYFNGGHSFSPDGVSWSFSSTAAYTKNISWASGGWMVMGRRERPGLLLDDKWRTPLALFTSVMVPQGSESWLQSQPIRQVSAGGGGGLCGGDMACNLNGVCNSEGRCVCDPQWTGNHCGELALEPADRNGGYHRPGFNSWGGNPFYSAEDGMYHVMAAEMTHRCEIHSFPTNSQIVHATSPTPTGRYQLTPIGGGTLANASAVHAGLLPAPSSTVLHAPFAHAPHTWKDPQKGVLLVVFEGRRVVPDAQQRRCSSKAGIVFT